MTECADGPNHRHLSTLFLPGSSTSTPQRHANAPLEEAGPSSNLLPLPDFLHSNQLSDHEVQQTDVQNMSTQRPHLPMEDLDLSSSPDGPPPPSEVCIYLFISSQYSHSDLQISVATHLHTRCPHRFTDT